MIARYSLTRFRALAALLLFAAALVAGSVDAVACEPEIETSQVSLTVASDSDHAPAKGDNDRGDACIHGHCHAGSPMLASSESLAATEFAGLIYNPAEPTALGPPVNHTPKRPPRA